MVSRSKKAKSTVWILVVVLALTSVTLPPNATAQDSLARQVELLGRAAREAQNTLYGRRSLGDGSVPMVDVREQALVGCAAGWADLSVWRATPGAAHRGDASVAIVRGELYPVAGMGASDLGGLVDALLIAGRVDREKPTIECLVATIVSMLGIPDEDTYDASPPQSEVGMAQVRPQIREGLPIDWPTPGIWTYGDVRVAVFTVFDLGFSTTELFYQPTAFALAFSPELRLLSWASREGAPIRTDQPD